MFERPHHRRIARVVKGVSFALISVEKSDAAPFGHCRQPKIYCFFTKKFAINIHHSMTIKPFAVFVLLFVTSSAQALNIGPYQLGMTSKQASKPGFRACVADSFSKRPRVRCDIQMELQVILPRVSAGTIWFDAKTTRLIEIKIQVDEMPSFEVAKALDMDNCPKNFGGPGFAGQCIELPDKVRFIEDHQPRRNRHNTRPFNWTTVQGIVDPAWGAAWRRHRSNEHQHERDIARITGKP